MPPTEVAPRLLSWATDIEQSTILQAAKTARLPFVEGHIALMPDAHVGFGSTVGSVIPTHGAIMPAAVGVDIGCGMVAVETDLTAEDLPDDLAALMPLIERAVPAGVGKGHDSVVDGAALDTLGLPDGCELSSKQRATLELQFGTLGSGNHFVEVCLDERDRVWTVLHSGSRGIGNQLAKRHIDGAKGEMKRMFIRLEDPDLAYLGRSRRSTATTTSPSARTTTARTCGSPARARSRRRPATRESSPARWARGPTS
jgi:RNA-splicing ligase RtcB